MTNMANELVDPTRNQYITVCGGLPPKRNEEGDFTCREEVEIAHVLNAIQASEWYNTKFKGIWSLFPLSEDGVLTFNRSKNEVYAAPDNLLVHIVQNIWKSIGRPIIKIEEDKSLSFYVPDGTWPYVSEERNKGTIAVEDRIIDIEHVCDLVDDELCNLTTWFWNSPAFSVVKMVRDLIEHVDRFGFDEDVTKKLGCMRKVVHPWADKVWESSTISNYPYDRIKSKEDKEDKEDLEKENED